MSIEKYPSEQEPNDSVISLEEAIERLRQALGLDANDTGGYEVFTTSESREELYEIGKGIAEYALSEDIGTICFMDRSARPAYVALKAYWQKAYPHLEMPDIRFINPKGCVSREDVIDGRVDLERLAVNDLYKQGELEDIAHIRPEREIVEELHKIMKRSERSNEPMLLFDACIHTGESILPVITRLLQAGVADIRIGTVSDFEMQVGLPLDLQILDETPDQVCYPFGSDRMVTKMYGSVASERNPDERDKAAGRLIRQEIRQAVEEQWALEHPTHR